MPIFEYKCTSCGAEFEYLTTRARADEVTCQSCGAAEVARQLSTFGVAHAQPSAASPCAAGACSPDGPAGCCPSGACPLT